MPPRRSHRKSRLGCLQCKRRKIKVWMKCQKITNLPPSNDPTYGVSFQKEKNVTKRPRRATTAKSTILSASLLFLPALQLQGGRVGASRPDILNDTPKLPPISLSTTSSPISSSTVDQLDIFTAPLRTEAPASPPMRRMKITVQFGNFASLLKGVFRAGRPFSGWPILLPEAYLGSSKDAQTHGVGVSCTLLCDPWQTGFSLLVTRLGGPFVRINLSFVGCDEADFITMANAND
ncbi:hypothetical protein GX48_05875 [Paracoccidioides brasiliensis]|nr:hypothetical protein GX48_05875 [Paracoccidioides brasiliensis]